MNFLSEESFTSFHSYTLLKSLVVTLTDLGLLQAHRFLLFGRRLASLTYWINFLLQVNKEDTKEAAKLFCVNDFVGDMCHAIASRIRGAVSSVSFDDFHKNSAKIIR